MIVIFLSVSRNLSGVTCGKRGGSGLDIHVYVLTVMITTICHSDKTLKSSNDYLNCN